MGRDDADFADFVAARSGSLLRTAFLLTGDHQRAEDLVQITLTKIYLRWQRVARMDEPTAYARRVLINEASSRRWWRSSAELVGVVPDRPTGAADDRFAISDVVWNAVLALSPRQRAVVVLRYYEGLSEWEIADVLGVAVGTVKSTAHAANRHLARTLADVVTERTEGSRS